jgi:hypothetical protein
LANKQLVIEASVANLTIRLRPDATPAYRWLVTWLVRHSREEFDTGTRIFSDKDMKGAFLTDGQIEFGEMLITEHGGSSAHQGHYLRFRKYLNIPGPGTGYDGDPNISIEVDEAIKSAVQQLLESARPKQ